MRPLPGQSHTEKRRGYSRKFFTAKSEMRHGDDAVQIGDTKRLSVPFADASLTLALVAAQLRRFGRWGIHLPGIEKFQKS